MVLINFRSTRVLELPGATCSCEIRALRSQFDLSRKVEEVRAELSVGFVVVLAELSAELAVLAELISSCPSARANLWGV